MCSELSESQALRKLDPKNRTTAEEAYDFIFTLENEYESRFNEAFIILDSISKNKTIHKMYFSHYEADGSFNAFILHGHDPWGDRGHTETVYYTISFKDFFDNYEDWKKENEPK